MIDMRKGVCPLCEDTDIVVSRGMRDSDRSASRYTIIELGIECHEDGPFWRP